PAMHPLRLRGALRDLLASHAVFRSALREREGRIWIEAQEVGLPAVPVIDSTAAEIAARGDALLAEPLGISRAPLWRAAIRCTLEGGSTLLFAIHHALFDGSSLNLFLTELGRRYETGPNGRAPGPPRLTCFDYGLWARCLPGSRPYREAIAYWR